MSLNNYVDKKVCIITTDGRNLVGILSAHDYTTNLVLRNTVERVIRNPDEGEPSAEVPLGLYIVRGENVCLVGLVDEPLDASINWTEVKGEAIGTTKH
ncbi:Sm-like ribonucleoprotein [Trichocladium antarcticum]|uniref:LSM2-LSM8 complex subunit LSM8 n=1 Tax=Trichocladium antarcticum TaxID=1450529 RepID=A0AAN6UJ21_9PEZI|nr:Sm-like ribonucleoprotein [Trichocladium antarcticum]